MACTTISAAEATSLEGKTLGPTDWREITQATIDLFAEATGDRQWIHVDPERAARESPFRKKTVAHGYFTLALVPGFFFSLLEVRDCRLVVNLEAERATWPAPVLLPSRVRMLAHVEQVQLLDSGFDLKLRAVIEVEGQRRPALEVWTTYRYYAKNH